jgi:hypothetical protein
VKVKRLALALAAGALLLLAAVPPAAAKGGLRVYPRVGISLGHSWGYNSWGYHPWGGYPYYYGGYGPRWGYTSVYPNDSYRYGALDLDIVPERAEVWVDGRKIGVADDFDGFPEYLLLEKGTYDVVFYSPGYKTLARQYSIYPGLVIDVEDNLEPGEAVHPQQLGPTSTERRDARIARDRERLRELGQDDDEALVERSQRRAARPEAEPSLDARGEPGRLRLEILPEDASVYLDGRFLGTGRELARLRAGLIVDPGEHTLQVVRPGREEQARTFEVEAGRELELRVELSED